MQRIHVLLQKINELAQSKQNQILDVDLMLDYTRVLYADLLELRNNLATQKLYVPKETSQPVSPQEVAAKQTVAAPPPKPMAQKQPNGEIAQKEIFNSTPDTPDSIRSHIGINDKYQFISELFGNNKEAYEEVISMLDTFRTYTDAKNWLGHVHQQNNWEDDHETVISFYATLHLFFNQQLK